MSLKQIIESFTKKEIQSFLKKLKDDDYRSSWKKDKLVNQVLEYDIEEVLKTFTSNQLKKGLAHLEQPTKGDKTTLFDRLSQILSQKSSVNRETLSPNKETFQCLLRSQDLESVNQGLELLFSFSKDIVSDVLSTQDDQRFVNTLSTYPHKNTVLKKLIQYAKKNDMYLLGNTTCTYKITLWGYLCDYCTEELEAPVFNYWLSQQNSELIDHLGGYNNASSEFRLRQDIFLDPDDSDFLLEDKFTTCIIVMTVGEITCEIFNEKLDTSKTLEGINVTIPTSDNSMLLMNHFLKQEHINKPEPLEEDDYGMLFGAAYRQGDMVFGRFTTVGLPDLSKLHISAWIHSEIGPVLDSLAYAEQPIEVEYAMDFNEERRQAVLYY